MVFRDQLDGFAPVAGFGDDFEIGLLVEEQPQARPDDRVIVREEYVNL
jgi:hypothetical protein